MNAFLRLNKIKQDALITLNGIAWHIAVAPDMGGRVFVEVGGIFVHRIDWETVETPNRPFNNFGGVNLWPAPEGGPFGLNYRGDEWMVQPAINDEPFVVRNTEEASVDMHKRTTLTNRMGTSLEVDMTRTVAVVPPSPCLADCGSSAIVAVETRDRIEVRNEVSSREALIAAWNLEQFDATDDTVAFVRVPSPGEAINFDYYSPAPTNLITTHPDGFSFRVNGRQRAQIGLRTSARTERIGFYDLSRGLVCIKEHLGPNEGLFFNIADNVQPNGPNSAADNYSIFNSDDDMRAFELETIGSLCLSGDRLKESSLASRTTYVVFKHPDRILQFLRGQLGEDENSTSIN